MKKNILIMVLAVIGFSLSGASYSAESDKPEPKPGPKPDKMTAPGQALPMPQGTQGSR